jgi:uncharacterized protein YggE
MKCMTLSVLANVILFSACAQAQQEAGKSASRVVTGTGSAVVKQMPSIMRMSIQFKEAGKDLPDALKNLKDRRDSAAAQLAKLGAKKESIREGLPAVVGDDPQMAQAMAMMNGRPGGAKKKKAGAAKVNVSGTLSAEWPLPAGNMEEVLLAAQELKDKIQAAELAGSQKEKKKLSPEEQEEAEEMEMLQRQYSQRPEVKPGEPAYVFYATISPADQQKARTTAFQKARQQAEQLASASGEKLGKLRSLQSGAEAASPWQMGYGRFPQGDDGSQEDETETDEESVSKSLVCAMISFRFSIHATFDIAE